LPEEASLKYSERKKLFADGISLRSVISFVFFAKETLTAIEGDA
jgi:hypothetical protein